MLEVVAVFRNNIGGDVEIEVVAGESEAETARLTFAADDRGKTGELRDEELIIVDEGVVIVKQGVFFALRGLREALRGGSNLGHDSD